MSNKMWTVIATTEVDRNGNSLSKDCFNDFLKSNLPVVVLMNFDTNNVLGRVTKLKIDSDKLYAYGEFDTFEDYYAVPAYSFISREDGIIKNAKIFAIGLTMNPADSSLYTIGESQKLDLDENFDDFFWTPTDKQLGILDSPEIMDMLNRN